MRDNWGEKTNREKKIIIISREEKRGPLGINRMLALLKIVKNTIQQQKAWLNNQALFSPTFNEMLKTEFGIE